MDVQGTELMVLAGAENYLSKVKMIWMEVEKVSFIKDSLLKMTLSNYMRKNEFVKIIDTVDNISGDQLYVSRLLNNKIKLKKRI